MQTKRGLVVERLIHGKIRGRTIELVEDLRLPEGQEVEVLIRVVAKLPPKAGEGLLRTEGALADDIEWDAIMEEIHQTRKLERQPQLPDRGEAV